MCAGSARPQLSSGQAALAEPALATATGPPASKRCLLLQRDLRDVCHKHDDRCGHNCLMLQKDSRDVLVIGMMVMLRSCLCEYHAECSLGGMLVI